MPSIDAIAVDQPTPLLGGLTPSQFMKRYWQRKPLLVRQAWPGVQPPLARPAMFALAANEDVESRLVVRAPGDPADAGAVAGDWAVRHGPMPRRAMPALSQPGWTLLVQGLDLHVPAARAMLDRFRFVPEARLDDLMISWASPGGGVGPHVDAYDVFLIQVSGRRRWRIAPPGDDRFIDGLPLKILRRFKPVHDWVLEPGDMLYLPPRWGHDGTAEGGPCMTCSAGFRVPSAAGLAREVLLRLADSLGDALEAGEPDEQLTRLYQDPGQPATAQPGAVPAALAAFAQWAVNEALQGGAVARALGEVLSEPKPHVWFPAPGDAVSVAGGVRLSAGTRLMYDGESAFINGESYRMAGRDAALIRRLADARQLGAAEVRRLSAQGRDGLQGWLDAGWLLPQTIAA